MDLSARIFARKPAFFAERSRQMMSRPAGVFHLSPTAASQASKHSSSLPAAPMPSASRYQRSLPSCCSASAVHSLAMSFAPCRARTISRRTCGLLSWMSAPTSARSFSSGVVSSPRVVLSRLVRRMAAMRTLASASLRPAVRCWFSRPLICVSRPRARARMRGFSLFQSWSSAGSAAAPILCSACQARDCVGLFGDWSAATAPAAVETSGAGAPAFAPVAETR